MKKFPLHENLSTSYVNLAELVDYLRGIGFVGAVRLELSGYDAEITFTNENSILARDHLHCIGRISSGEDVLRRILKRAAEPCGRIDVIRTPAEVGSEKIFVDRAIVNGARRTVGHRAAPFQKRSRKFEILTPISNCGDGRSDAELPSPRDWNEILEITEELLQAIDESTSSGNLNFQAAFQNACALVSCKYNFMDPDINMFAYRNGRLLVRRMVPLEHFAAGIGESLGRILRRLSEEPRFGNASHRAKHRIRVLMQRRVAEYDKFAITPQLEKALRIT